MTGFSHEDLLVALTSWALAILIGDVSWERPLLAGKGEPHFQKKQKISMFS